MEKVFIADFVYESSFNFVSLRVMALAFNWCVPK